MALKNFMTHVESVADVVNAKACRQVAIPQEILIPEVHTKMRWRPLVPLGDTGDITVQRTILKQYSIFAFPFIFSISFLSFRELLSSDAMKDYNRARVYLDENYKSQEHFTVNFSLSQV